MVLNYMESNFLCVIKLLLTSIISSFYIKNNKINKIIILILSLFILINTIFSFYNSPTNYGKLFFLNKIKSYEEFKTNLKYLKSKYHPDVFKNGNNFIILNQLNNYIKKHSYLSNKYYNLIVNNYQLNNDLELLLNEDINDFNTFTITLSYLSEYLVFIIILVVILLLNIIHYKILFFIFYSAIMVFIFLLNFEYFLFNKTTFYESLCNEYNFFYNFNIYQISNIMYKLLINLTVLYYCIFKKNIKKDNNKDEEREALDASIKTVNKEIDNYIKSQNPSDRIDILKTIISCYKNYDKNYYNFKEKHHLNSKRFNIITFAYNTFHTIITCYLLYSLILQILFKS